MQLEKLKHFSTNEISEPLYKKKPEEIETPLFRLLVKFGFKTKMQLLISVSYATAFSKLEEGESTQLEDKIQ